MPSLMSLQDEQALFALALRSDANSAVDTRVLWRGSAPRRAAGLAAYRRNHATAVCGALRLAYPRVGAIVGEAFFDAAALLYAHAYPSASGDLHDFGEHFAVFLRAYAPAAALPYLPDVAALDWALHRAQQAADVPALDAAQFAAPLQHSPAHLRVRLHPAVALLRSAHPLVDIWRFHEPGGEEASPRWGQAQHALVFRPQWQPTVREASAAEAAALHVALQGGTLEAALAAALEQHAVTDLQALLAQWLRDGLVVQLALDPLQSLSSLAHYLAPSSSAAASRG